ncbi:MAG: MFS transporter [Rickettsiaceae bacterium]
MHFNSFSLLKDIRFLPLFIVQACGCFNDSIMKNALIIMITYKLSCQFSGYAKFLVLLANAAFIIPFVLFASIAGYFADKFERKYIVNIIKACEILIVCLAIYGFNNNDVICLFIAICLMGVHSTFFGPIKYALLPDHLNSNELLMANGLIEASTFITILLGTLIGGLYTNFPNFVIISMLCTSIVGLLSSVVLPKSNNYNSNLRIKFNIIRDTSEMISYAYHKKQLYLSILAISWFWFIGATILAQIPSLVKDILVADENVANLFLAVFSIGVGAGSLGCTKIFGHKINTQFIFLAAFGISLFCIDLFFASRISAANYKPDELRSILIFLSKVHNWRIVIDLFGMAVIGGIYLVPLFAVMQYFTSPSHRSRVIAINNLINSLFMVASTVILSALFYFNFSVPSAILFISICNIFVSYIIYKLTPEADNVLHYCFKWIFRILFDFLYKIEINGISNFHKAGKRVVIIANHVSYIDPALIATYLPEKVSFVINKTQSERWWVRPFLKLSKTFPIDFGNSLTIKALICEIKKHNKIVIFPEGRISTTGSLMKVYEGPGMIADKADAAILPIRIDGSQFTHFSKMKNILKIRLLPKIVITILPPVKLNLPNDVVDDARLRRKYIGQKLYEIMIDMMFESSDYKNTIFQSLIGSAKIYGYNNNILQDINDTNINYRELLEKSFAFGSMIAHNSSAGQYVGIMMPNMAVTMILFYAMQARSIVPAMINSALSANEIIAQCKTVGITSIYTSRKFIEQSSLHNLIEELLSDGDIIIAYLEDLVAQMSFWVKCISFVMSYFPQTYYDRICCNNNENSPCVVLFKDSALTATESDQLNSQKIKLEASELPIKAIVLSHLNIQANRFQISIKLDFNPYDLAFNALSMSNCFGLISSLMTLLNGVRIFLYPHPLHYRIIPEIVYDIGATIMFSANSFLTLYAQHAHPYDFYSVKHVFSAIEKLEKSTNDMWLHKYGIRIFEVYDSTEAGVIALNTPMHYQSFTSGKLLPKIEYILKDVDGINDGKKLYIKGPNIMFGYITNDSPCVIQSTQVAKLGNGWHDTGDIIRIVNGYVVFIDYKET